MASENTVASIGDLPIKIGDGNYSGKYPKASEFVETGIPFITASDFSNGRISSENFRFISEEQHAVLLKGHIKPGDVLLVTRGNGTGDVAWVDPEYDDFNINAQLVLLRSDERVIHNRFLYYLLSSKEYKDIFVSYSSGSAQPQLPIHALKQVELRFPPFEVQVEIGRHLSILDNKIELNRQTNQTLEQIAQAIFKSWFVDFEPVKAKMAAKQAGASAEQIEQAAICAISGKTPEQLAQLDPQTLQQLKTTAALFPDALVDSELGEMPEGWEVKTLEKLSLTIAMGPFGSNIKVETFVDEGVPIINGQQLKGTMLEDGDNKFLTYEHADKLIKSNVYRGDIVITHRGTLGQVSIIPEGSKYERYIVSQSQCYIRPDREVVSPLFMIYYFKSDVGQHELLAHKSQVGVPSIAMPVTNLRKIELLAPSKVVSDKFQYIVADLQRNMSINIDEIYSLQELRDTLLPKLLSGELHVNPESPSLQEAI